jgi:inosose dehydratase
MGIGFSRRRFVLTAAAAAGATWFDVPRLLADTRDESMKKYGGYPMGIQSYSLRGFGVDGALDKIKELEIHYVEFFGAHFGATDNPDKIAEMKKKLADRDISMSAHGVDGFGKDHEANKRYFEFAKLAGFPVISADFQPDAHDSLNKLCEEYKTIKIAGHNHGPGHHWNKVTDILAQTKGLHPNIGACADLGHYIRSGEDPAAVIRALKGRLFGIHLKDFKEPKGNAPGCILGKGVMNIREVFVALKEVKFPADGALSLEYEENEKNPMEDLKACFAAASEAAKSVA